jgi:DNA repair exonuclease SbcCD ATPase subunit
VTGFYATVFLAALLDLAYAGRRIRAWRDQVAFLHRQLDNADAEKDRLRGRIRFQHWQNAIERRKRRYAEQERDNYLTIAAQHLVDLRRTRRELKAATERLALLSAEREVTSKQTPRRQLASVKKKAG